MTRWIPIIVSIVVWTGTCSATGQITKRTYTNPVIDEIGPADPTVIRFEGVWGTAPRPLDDRTSPDGGIACDPVDIVTTGVNGTIIRLVNEQGR